MKTRLPRTLMRALLLAAALAWTAAPALAQHEGHSQQDGEVQHDEHTGHDRHAGHGSHEGHGSAQGGEDAHAAHRAMLEGGGGEKAQDVSGLDIPDVPVQTQDGETVRFYSDLVEGRTVAMNFVFTTCTTICPPMGANFGRLQKELGSRLGKDLHLISVSVDPTTDTPDRLKAWGAKFGAKDGWTLVTGDQQEVERLLKALQVFNADIRDHAPVVLIGNDAEGRWTRAYGLAGPEELAGIIERVHQGDDAMESHDHSMHGHGEEE